MMSCGRDEPLLTSLQWRYPPSSVLFDHPTALYLIWLPFLIRTSYLNNQEGIGSPQVIYRHCKTWLALRHRRSIYILAIQIYTCCLPLERKRRPTKHVDFGAQSLSALFPDCLHLRSIVTFASPKLATNDAATSYWMRFPLINLYTLLGVPFVPSTIHWVPAKLLNRVHAPW